KPIRKDFSQLESFVVYLCVEGLMAVKSLETIVPIHAGECVLVPAVADTVELYSEGMAKVLEVYVEPDLAPDDGYTHKYDRDWIAQFMDDQQQFIYGNIDEDNCGCEHHHHDDCGCEHHHHDDCGCEHHHHDDCDCGHHHK
ncbi:MAG: hypothetical protein II793_02055, partial [Bacteroidales bacterium]|nr:hypothetical protein [Bacteroidales bacterium]